MEFDPSSYVPGSFDPTVKKKYDRRSEGTIGVGTKIEDFVLFDHEGAGELFFEA